LTIFGGSFTVAALPQINSLQWNPIAVGAQQCATGTAFGASQGSVIVNGTTVPAASIASWTNTQVCFVMPSAVGAGTATLQINNGAGPGNTASFTVAAVPTVSSINPITANAGAQLTITGAGLGQAQTNSQVQLINGSTGALGSMGIVNWTNTQILATVPSGLQAGSYGVYIKTEGLTTYSGQLSVVSGPVISSVTPASGSVETQVTITGSAFGSTQGTSQVQIGSQVLTVSSWSDTSILATIPDSATSGDIGSYSRPIVLADGSINVASWNRDSSQIRSPNSQQAIPLNNSHDPHRHHYS
jgi:hypothetical protein